MSAMSHQTMSSNENHPTLDNSGATESCAVVPGGSDKELLISKEGNASMNSLNKEQISEKV